MGMKTSEMNASGRMMALATADAAAADGHSPATAMPSAAKAATPTRNVTIAAGQLGRVESQVVGHDAEARPSRRTPATATTTAEPTNPPR